VAYTTDDLLKSIKQKAFVPTSQITFQDEDILEMATNELYDTIVPLVLTTREEFYVTSQDMVTAGTTNAKLDIPERAIGIAVRELSALNGTVELNLTRYDIESLAGFVGGGITNGFYLQGNQICLLGNTNYDTRIYYHCRPGALVKTTKAAKVTSINTATNTITVTARQPGWTPGAQIDFVKAAPGFDTLSTSNVIIANPGATQIQIAAIPERLKIGDWVCTDNTSPVPQIPVEFYSYLAQLTAVQLLDALGDKEARDTAASKLEKMEANALSMVTPRVVGEAKKVVGFYNKNATTYRGY
jgi:hypothetical protein